MPVALIVLIFYGIMRSVFFLPLLKVMKEREARTRGAENEAVAAKAAAAERAREYEEALKKARAKVYAEQEAARQKLLDQRAGNLKEARAKASAEVNAAKDRVAKEVAGVKQEVEAGAAQLSVEIAQRVMQPSTSGPGSSR